MRIAATTLWIAAVVAGWILTGSAQAEDSSTKSSLASKLNQQIDQAATSGAADGSSTSDLNARVDELEATRSSLDQKKPAAVSLSVSGWVDQQVMMTGKQ